MAIETSSSGGGPSTATLQFGPSVRHAAAAAAAAFAVATVLEHAGAAPAVQARWLPAGTWLAQKLALAPSVVSLIAVAVCITAAGALLYDATRRWALPSSAADATWWLALGPFAAFAWGAPLWGIAMAIAAGFAHAVSRERFALASVTALALAAIVPAGVVFVVGVAVHYAAERAWRMGARPTLSVLAALGGTIAMPGVSVLRGDTVPNALVNAWWGGPAPWSGLVISTQALPLVGAAVFGAAVIALIGVRPTKAPGSIRLLCVLAACIVAVGWAAGDDSGAVWCAALGLTPAVGLLAARAEPHRIIARLCWTTLPLLALLAR
jgi:hypothetical protein